MLLDVLRQLPSSARREFPALRKRPRFHEEPVNEAAHDSSRSHRLGILRAEDPPRNLSGMREPAVLGVEAIAEDTLEESPASWPLIGNVPGLALPQPGESLEPVSLLGNGAASAAHSGSGGLPAASGPAQVLVVSLPPCRVRLLSAVLMGELRRRPCPG